ncbi:Trypsin delta/gamma [Lucilia cuprina]|uniref:Trypsin delta/gamma n=1 Tax=Lucilia cuprina TaxID=7375 RepID=A0A0L0C7Z1_LUCCU|nr:trypsin delta [Lucilia cuprina]KAI8123773.1 Trypsin delta/gamma-like protein [Lucilia cuprina]KNC27534.1 Trypsin delta/gamma [Lucilia cuprina]
MFKLLAVVAVLLVPGLMADIQSMVPLPDGRIVGGDPTHISKYPHQISMRYNGRHRCGGSVYASNVIVSAAHCVAGGVDASKLSIVAGSTYLNNVTWELPVDKYIIHENYKTSNNDYDVAILTLKGHFPFNEFIQPIALAKSRPEAGTEVTVTGWGTLTEGGSIPNQLQEVHINYVDNSVCKKSYPLQLTDRMLCARVDGGGKDACQGDSGGPLILNNELLGVVSWGIGCARKSFPGVYASVPQLYEWIEKTAKVNTKEYAFL